MPKVYVVAWESTSGGGFDWYRTAKAANEAYETEKENEQKFSDWEWKAFKFSYIAESEDTATEEIDMFIWNTSPEDMAKLPYEAEE